MLHAFWPGNHMREFSQLFPAQNALNGRMVRARDIDEMLAKETLLMHLFTEVS
mgnify:CR=1 FL=1